MTLNQEIQIQIMSLGQEMQGRKVEEKLLKTKKLKSY